MRPWSEIKDELVVDGKLNVDLVRERYLDVEEVCTVILDEKREHDERAWLLTSLVRGLLDGMEFVQQRIEKLESNQAKEERE